MMIVIPTDGEGGLDERPAEHFGRCNTYTFLDETGKVIKIVKNTSEHMRGSGLPPELMKEHGAGVLICRGLGPRALGLCERLGIMVYVCHAGTVKEMFESWRNKKAKKAGQEDICEEHRA